MAEIILTPICEAELPGFSHGFRPRRGAHDAPDALALALQTRKVSWILDADIQKFSDRIDRDWLARLLEHRIADRRVVRLIAAWLNAGVMEGGKWRGDLRGAPRGAVISPILANIRLHCALDMRFHRKWRRDEAAGEAIIARCAADFVVGFQCRRDAQDFPMALKGGLGKFALELHEGKTRLIEFGRFAMGNRRARGAGKPETFDFPGFTHYCGTARNGGFGLGRKPVAKRTARTLKRIKEALRKRWRDDIVDVAKWLGRVVSGWLGYYAVPTSFRHLKKFARRIMRMWRRMLSRRSQKGRFAWDRLRAIAKAFFPPVKIRHPWPDQRLAVRHRS